MQYKKKDVEAKFFGGVQSNQAPCTDNRREFVESLLKERKVPKALAKEIAKALPTMTNGLAKAYIGILMPLERVRDPEAANEAGYYKLDDTVYQVKVSRQGNPYALVDDGFGKFEYAPGAIRKLKAKHRMTPAQIKKLGY